ncbi:MAG TPA: DapH/DapD/GlmU-related protein [Planctomycetota bacterium]|nr:DapH/DapD/GlmU-related protein [Planctomycetota bacterium]
MNFSPTNFFDLEQFRYREIFEGAELVWEVLGERLEDYIAATLTPEIRGHVMDGAWLMSDRIYIGEGTVVEPGALIKGPAIIGKNCEIRHTAYLRENVVIGDNCVVGHTTELKSCVLLNHVEAGHFTYIGDSVVGNNVMFGAGTKLANYKVNGTEVIVHDGDVDHPTGLVKVGAIIGDGCKFGCNSVTNPGTILERNCVVMPASCVRGCIAAGSTVEGSMPRRRPAARR